MNVLIGIFVILIHLAAGSALSHLTGGFFPGSVIGMALLFISLQTGLVKEHQVRAVATFLTDNLTILFMPAFVGIMELWGLISMNLWAWIAVIVISTFLVMISSGATQTFIERLSDRNHSKGQKK